MPSASSPVAYPPSSSPAPKRTRPAPKPLGKNKAIGGFLTDDDSEGDDDFTKVEPPPKRRMLEDSRAQDSGLEQIIKDDSAVKDVEIESTKTGTFAVGGLVVEDIYHDIDDDEQPELPPSISRSLGLPGVPSLPSFLSSRILKSTGVVTCSGEEINIQQRRKTAPISFEKLVSARSTTKAGRAKRSYYGIDIQNLVEEASQEAKKEKSKKIATPEEALPSVEMPIGKARPRRTLMWTEKYRARHFMELVGDDRTHRQVLKWLKAWDPIVFPKSGKAKPPPVSKRPGAEQDEEKTHRKILLLTGPPGLGKTTLAHVCARQAGYEIMEINASDERSKDVVKGRIRTSVGTESVKTGSTVTTKSGHVQKSAHPLCVVVDEVDGVVGGSGGSGEGGFVKALIDLIQLDQKNSGIGGNSGFAKKKKKGDDFRLMRPLILICNDVYHPSLRPLRHSNLAEIIHVGKPPIDAVIARMRSVFEKEGVSCDNDAVRRLCEATWGVSAAESRKGRETPGEGDLRGIMVVGEWAAGKLKASSKDGKARLTRQWVDKNMVENLSHGGGGARGMGRGGTKDLVNRVFLEGAGFPKTTHFNPAPGDVSNELPKTQLGVAEIAKRAGMDRLREMVDTSGEIDRIVTEIWSQYPSQPFNDDSLLSKPDSAYEWLHFHDKCSSRVFTHQDFELSPYLSQPVLACHHLFASPARHHFGNTKDTKKWGEEEEEDPTPFSGPRADYEAFEAEKSNRATVVSFQASLNSTLLRSFRSPEDIAVDLLPYLTRMLAPEIKPIIVGGSGDQKGIASVRKESEKALVRRAVDAMGAVGVIFERGKLEGDFGNRVTQWVYRMEPPLDMLVTFDTAPLSTTAPAPVRFAVRQVLDQEYQKNIIVRENAARQARYRAGNLDDDVDFSFSKNKENKGQHAQERVLGPKKDFFGRVVREEVMPLGEIDGNAMAENRKGKGGKGKDDNKVWVSFHEGFSNAVKKPITIEELMRGL
ncbi:chromosome transmission fidelity protein-like protein 18 [Halenospora varia]|nr:chromosome transmission fidelity protein-like protein 18 [Halenospora varia]